MSKMIGKYEIIEEIGRSEISIVYKANQVSLSRIVALRVLDTKYSSNDFYVEIFRKEARTPAKLSHPNIAQIYGIGEENGIHYVASEYCEGKTLRDIIVNEKKLSSEKAGSILAKMAEVIDYAHEEKVLCGIIKPFDIVAGPGEQIKVVKFGAVPGKGNVSVQNLPIEYIRYVSPEMVREEKIDGRSDIYSLGVLLYEMLTGKLPFNSVDSSVLAEKHSSEVPPPIENFSPEVSSALRQVVMKCLDKKPENRYPDAAGVVKDWRKVPGIVVEKSTVITRPFRKGDTIVINRKDKISPGKKRWLAAAFAAVFLALAAVFIILSGQKSLSIESNLQGVAVYIDDKYCGKTPVVVKGLSRGKHVVAGKKAGYKSSRQKIELGMGNASLQISLTKKPVLARVLTFPEGAQVYLDGVLQGTSPLLLRNLMPGEYKLKLMLNDYSAEQRVLKVDGNSPITLEVKLLSLHGTIAVESVPSGTEIHLDGTYMGITPKTIKQLRAGRHEVLLKKEGYHDFRRNIFLRERQKFSLRAELEEKFAVLVIRSNPADADVWLDGTPAGKTPLTLKKLRPSEYKLRVVKKGYADVERSVVLDTGKEKTAVDIEMKDITGFLLITCSPSGARIYVDGEDKGVIYGSLSVGNLDEGEHQVQVVKPGCRVSGKMFRITAGKTTIISIILEKIIKKWKPTVRLHLAGGGKLEGEIISRDEDALVVRVEDGLITLKICKVKSEEELEQ